MVEQVKPAPYVIVPYQMMDDNESCYPLLVISLLSFLTNELNRRSIYPIVPKLFLNMKIRCLDVR